jgi:N1-aminopropylagmatine ureohydrolase
MKFMDLAEEYSKKDSYFYVLPIEYEGKVSYGKGAVNGSKEIIDASKQLEYYDEQFDVEAFEKGIHTLNPLNIRDEDPKIAIEKITKKVQKHKNKFLISIGGDHSITIGTVKGFEENHDTFSVIVLDAHPDMFHSWNKSQFNHRCTAQRISEKHKTLLLGIRSMDKDEKDIISENENVDMVKAYEFDKEELINKLKKLDKKIYISIDVDVFDPSFIRNTGTPEPGGFFWDRVIDILKIIFESKEIIGADVVEFSPKDNFRTEAYSLAKLCYKLMALKIYNNL